MKVDFMIVGAQKCATTTLFEVLERHPALSGCGNKEPHFFSTTEDWKTALDDYHKLYTQKEGLKFFEGSTTYTFAPHRNKEMWKDLHEYNPEMKFIYMVRNPLARLVSAYMHSYERGYTERELNDALVQEPYMVDVTRYMMQIAPYLKTFGNENVHIIDFDDFIKDREGVMQKLSLFLEIPYEDFTGFEEAHANASIGRQKLHIKWDKDTKLRRILEGRFPKIWTRLTDNSSRSFDVKPQIELALQEKLLKDLEPDIAGMEKLLGKDLTHWREIKT